MLSNVSSSGKYLYESLPASFSFCSWHKEATESPWITTLHGPWICPRPDGNWHHLTQAPSPRAVNPSPIYLRWQAYSGALLTANDITTRYEQLFPNKYYEPLQEKFCTGIIFMLFSSVFDQKLWKLDVRVTGPYFLRSFGDVVELHKRS